MNTASLVYSVHRKLEMFYPSETVHAKVFSIITSKYVIFRILDARKFDVHSP